VIVLVALTIGLVFWVVAWALGGIAVEAFLFTMLITFMAAAAQQALPFVQRLMSGAPKPPRDR